MLKVLGGRYAGDLADGVIKPDLPVDYRRSGMWRRIGSAPVPDTGDRGAGERSARPGGGAPAGQVAGLRLRPDRQTNDKLAAAMSWSGCRQKVVIERSAQSDGLGPSSLDVVSDAPALQGDLVLFAWGPDWANASAVIPQALHAVGSLRPLPSGRCRARRRRINDALVRRLTATAQAEQWMALNEVGDVRGLGDPPEAQSRVQRLPARGSDVRAAAGDDGRVYLWAPSGSWRLRRPLPRPTSSAHGAEVEVGPSGWRCREPRALQRVVAPVHQRVAPARRLARPPWPAAARGAASRSR